MPLNARYCPLSHPYCTPILADVSAIAPFSCYLSCFSLHFSPFFCSQQSIYNRGHLPPAMQTSDAAPVCIGDLVQQHRCVLGTRRVIRPEFLLHAASIRASDESLIFHASTTLAHISVSHRVFSDVTASCLSDMICPIMQEACNLLGCIGEFVGAVTEAMCSVFHKRMSPKVETRVTNFITPLSAKLHEKGKRKVG